VFIVALDDDWVWYRCHHLFVDFLRNHLERVLNHLSNQLVVLVPFRGLEAQRRQALGQLALSGSDHDRAVQLMESSVGEERRHATMARPLQRASSAVANLVSTASLGRDESVPLWC
jgi:hypothetical protein